MIKLRKTGIITSLSSELRLSPHEKAYFPFHSPPFSLSEHLIAQLSFPWPLKQSTDHHLHALVHHLPHHSSVRIHIHCHLPSSAHILELNQRPPKAAFYP